MNTIANRNFAWQELKREAANLSRWAHIDGPERAAARLKAALQDYENAIQAAKEDG